MKENAHNDERSSAVLPKKKEPSLLHTHPGSGKNLSIFISIVCSHSIIECSPSLGTSIILRWVYQNLSDRLYHFIPDPNMLIRCGPNP